jgi:integrase
MTTTLEAAVELTRSVRETWQPDAKGYLTTVINIGHCLDVLGAQTDIATIKTIDFVRIQQHMKTLHKSPATTNRITQALVTVLNNAKKLELIDRVPHCPQLKEPPGREAIYTKDELNEILFHSQFLIEDAEVMHDLLLFAMKTAARQGEILKITWEEIDWVQRTLVFKDTKSGKNRTLPITDELLVMLERRFNERIDEAAIFPISKDKLLRRFKLIKKRAGIDDPHKCFHSIRHSICSQLHQVGATLPEIMEVMGHSQVSTTQRYSHTTMEGKARALALLN